MGLIDTLDAWLAKLGVVYPKARWASGFCVYFVFFTPLRSGWPPSLHIQLSLGLCAGARVLCDLWLKFEK